MTIDTHIQIVRELRRRKYIEIIMYNDKQAKLWDH